MARVWPNNAGNYLKTGNVTIVTLGSENFCIAGWLKLNSNGAADQTVVSKYNGSFGPLMRCGNGKISCFWIDSGASGHEAVGSTVMSTGVWYHVAAAWTAGFGMRVYVNGVLDGTDTTGTTMSSTSDTTKGWVLGARGNGGGATSNPLDGQLAAFSIHNDDLSQGSAQGIAALAKGVAPRFVREANLHAYWPIYGSVSPEPDLSTARHPLTLVGTLNMAGDHAPVGPYQLPPLDAVQVSHT